MTKRIIYTNDTGGISIIVPSGELSVEKTAVKDVPKGVDFEIVDTSAIPSERTFRNAWEKSGVSVVTDIPKAKVIAHELRRAARDAEMKPLDLQSTIPYEDVQAEASRQLIRDKYAIIQMEIDAANDEDGLLNIVGLL